MEEKEIRAVALDGYRLALIKKPLAHTNINVSVIVPSKSLNEIGRILEDNDDIKYLHSKKLMVDLGTTKLLDGEFFKLQTNHFK